mmetsp:Transcript_31298/g.74661  ORF Transcript_31298/g.74661 Transcript_31298/m.74661 type:complete len:230 (+) Transcript_31298:111-800(+)
MMSRILVGCGGGVSSTAARFSRPLAQFQQHFITTTPPLRVDAADDNDAGTDGEKLKVAQRWMKWNQRKTWRYEPNEELIARVGQGSSPLDAFRDTVPKEKRDAEPVGRSWSAKELRRKSYDDLHKLWLVLYKEKNMLMTEANLARRHGYQMIQPERKRKVRKSMGAIKHVLGERKRVKLADFRAYKEELAKLDKLLADKMVDEMQTIQQSEMEDSMDDEAEKLATNDKI